eukprot:GHUV01009939.1.p1 GENE.GHUV01009939.1~~GHUV01009939.1.p1  ORF type:complete len:772 (+),score=256.40 GHUV01009939.1:334-2316(+)
MAVARSVAKPKTLRPAFHMAPRSGWINDPNGPVYHNGQYHMFYQHVPDSSEWQWGLVWGHAKSQDLVNWEHLPPALVPEANTPDRDGCFSGCTAVDIDGTPTMLYTGVVRKPEPQHGAFEHQLVAIPTDPSDPDLKVWKQLPGTFLPAPPADMDVTGWRDPFVLEKPSEINPYWYVMVGSGIEHKTATALVYRSKNLRTGWEFVGPLCESNISTMWECPIMAKLTSANPHPAASNNSHLQRHMFCVSPDYCVNMAQYYLGDYAEGKFDLENAAGPQPLDLGDVLYAPNVLTDKHGRSVLWGWMQERPALRPAGKYDSSCCLCVPRVLYLSPDGQAMLQEPLPELKLLRQQHTAWTTEGIPLSLLPGSPVDIAGTVSGSSHMDMEITVSKGDADSFAVVLHPFVEAGVAGAAGAAITYCWKTNTLQVISSTDLATLERFAAVPIARPVLKHLPAPAADEMEAARHAEMEAVAAGTPLRCGGQLRVAGAVKPYSGAVNLAAAGDSVVSLRVLIDGSCVEVFTCSGQALGTRVYRGDEAPLDAEVSGPVSCNGAAAYSGQIQLVSFGAGPALLLDASAYAMSSMWVQEQQQEAAVVVLPQPAATAVTTAAAEVLQGLIVAEAAASAAMLPVTQLTVDVAMAQVAGPLSPIAVLSPSATVKAAA